MEERVSTSTRVLGLLVELLGAERPRTKRVLRALPGYSDLSDVAFESQFQRDKAALREAGIVLETVPGAVEAYRVSADSFAAANVRLEDVDVALIRLAVGAWQSGPDAAVIAPKIAASTDSEGAPAVPLALRLEGAETVARIACAIAERRVLSFVYRSASGAFARAVEPWRLVVRGRALYLWGRDLDREDERLFRVSRFESEVEFLGEPGDAAPMPAGLPDPFDALLVAPTLLLREGAAPAIRRFATDEDGAAPDGWTRARGETGERGEWISRVLAEGEDAIVLEPEDLREQILERIRIAAQWGRADA